MNNTITIKSINFINDINFNKFKSNSLFILFKYLENTQDILNNIKQSRIHKILNKINNNIITTNINSFNSDLKSIDFILKLNKNMIVIAGHYEIILLELKSNNYIKNSSKYNLSNFKIINTLKTNYSIYSLVKIGKQYENLIVSASRIQFIFNIEYCYRSNCLNY